MSATNGFTVGGLRRGPYPPSSQPNPASKPSPHAQHPQYQPHYGTQQQQQQQQQQHQQQHQQQPPQPGPYSHHIFSNSTPPQVSTVQNGARPQPQMGLSLPGPPTRRSAPSRQMQAEATQSMAYLQPLNQQSMNQQSLGQQSMTQQSMSQQALGQQSMTQQSMNQQSISQQPMQSLTSQQMGQKPMGQMSMGQGMAQLHPPSAPIPLSMRSQTLRDAIQSNESPMMSQRSQQSMTPRPPSQPTLPPAQLQEPQGQQPQQIIQQVRQTPPQQHLQIQNPPQQLLQAQNPNQQQLQAQHPTPPQSEHTHQPQENHHDVDVDMGSPDDGEGESSMDSRVLPFVPIEAKGPIMSAPPEGGCFPTLEAVHKHVLEYCTSVGYAVVIGRSKKTVPGLKKVLFVCDRAGKPPQRVSPEQRKRKTSSRKCECQFGFFAIEQRTQWTVRYRPDTIHLKHNHGPSESPLLHPAARKLDSNMVARVKALKESGVGVSQTLEILQTDHPHVPLLPRDIYNARAAINRNPHKVATGLAENRPTIYSKPQPSAEERIRADLRREILKYKEDYDKLKEESSKEIEELKNKIRQKDEMIKKFEMFIDICNERVSVKLSANEGANGVANSSST